ncbi:uncharacterized protein [Physeter macrocephalus]|uniref:Uncharacterized protein isoform X1 n=1 Tax=Physeter macrocephalus TaxID=9755 RepID=A0A455ASH5_PHYMC|nr:uncharacterized protein LOC114484824 isoform X1 [Physeter catodon]|eukprot:XP_028339527.1 uncharacterized protein LOC114484824 isoform X1 [Physeter catodon]
MASEELASKLQRRLQWEEVDGGLQPAPRAAPVPEPQPQPSAWAPTARADAELSAQLNRRLDINEGAARPRRCKVFHPYSEFPEFSRRLIKDLESMFKLRKLILGCRAGLDVPTEPENWEFVKLFTKDQYVPGASTFREPLGSVALAVFPLLASCAGGALPEPDKVAYPWWWQCGHSSSSKSSGKSNHSKDLTVPHPSSVPGTWR